MADELDKSLHQYMKGEKSRAFETLEKERERNARWLGIIAAVDKCSLAEAKNRENQIRRLSKPLQKRARDLYHDEYEKMEREGRKGVMEIRERRISEEITPEEKPVPRELSELERLRLENERLRKENEELKKLVGSFRERLITIEQELMKK